jgi:class 3 adenylate cyclase
MNLQAKMRDLDLSVYDLPQTLALRVGLHYGPVTRMHDPITRRESIFGAQVAHAARIEPLAVPGAILASEAYISALALDKPSTVSSRYIGRKKLKGQDTPVRLFAINGYYAQSPKEQ